VGELLAEVTEIESRCDNAVFLLMNGAKVDGARRLCVDSWRYSGRPDEVLTIYDRGAEVVEEGIHSIAWLSKLAVQRKFWDQARFNELFRETDLYTFVRVLLETSGRHRAAYTKKLYVLATDEGSRSYYHSKTAIARVCEFPEIERMLVEIFGVPKARRLLQKERKNWLTERGLFAAKIGVFSDEYAEQIQFLQNPISPFWEERLLVRIVYLLTSIAPLKKFLKNWYFRSRGQPEGKLTSINRAS
jgi:hypothetical protein